MVKKQHKEDPFLHPPMELHGLCWCKDVNNLGSIKKIYYMYFYRTLHHTQSWVQAGCDIIINYLSQETLHMLNIPGCVLITYHRNVILMLQLFYCHGLLHELYTTIGSMKECIMYTLPGHVHSCDQNSRDGWQTDHDNSKARVTQEHYIHW